MSDEHTSFIKTPKQLAIVVVLAFAVPIALIGLVSQLVTGLRPSGSMEAETGVLNRIKPVGEVTLGEATVPKGDMTGEQVYQAVCKTCHEAGLTGAPKIGDKALWAPRIKQGVDALYASAIKGKNAMPPKGGSPDLADVEVQRAVVFMTNRSGASFKEPPAATASAAAGTAMLTPAATTSPAPATTATASKPTESTNPAAAKTGAALDMASGQALLQKDGCAACHGVDKKIVGPAYVDVAAKYKGDAAAAAKLVQKVKSGGAGVWGQVPMPPNPQVPEEDVKALVSWILTLKR